MLRVAVLNYQCVLELCKKAQGECDELTPPRCGRGKRSVEGGETRLVTFDVLKDNEMDVVTSVDILDTLEEEVEEGAAIPNRLIDQLNGLPYHPRGPSSSPPLLSLPSSLVGVEGVSGPGEQLCLSTPAFGMMLGISIILFLTAIITSSLLCLRVRYDKD